MDHTVDVEKTDTEKAVRISLTKAQRASEIGAELLSLCQSITSDGSLSPDEVSQLRLWLDEHKNSDMPAIVFLAPIVEGVLQDGIVTETERKELFLALEKVLPQDVRQSSRSARIALEKAAKEAAKEAAKVERESQREIEKAERERDRPIDRYDFMVAGTRYDGRDRIIAKYVHLESEITFLRDRKNAYSKNAIRIIADGTHEIGFVPEIDAEDLAPLLDDGHPYTASIKKMLTASRAIIPVVVADVYRPDAQVPDLKKVKDLAPKKLESVAPSTTHTMSRKPVRSSSGKDTIVTILIVIFVIGALIQVFG